MILPRAFLMPSAMVGGVVTGLLVWGLLLYYGRKKGTPNLQSVRKPTALPVPAPILSSVDPYILFPTARIPDLPQPYERQPPRNDKPVGRRRERPMSCRCRL